MEVKIKRDVPLHSIISASVLEEAREFGTHRYFSIYKDWYDGLSAICNDEVVNEPSDFADLTLDINVVRMSNGYVVVSSVDPHVVINDDTILSTLPPIIHLDIVADKAVVPVFIDEKKNDKFVMGLFAGAATKGVIDALSK